MAKQTLQKNSFLKYFEIYKDKFFKILLLNVIYFTALTVLLIVSFGLSYLLFDVFKLTAYLAPLALLPLIALGPVTAAVMKMCREYVREEPGFFWQDFKSALKSNIKQSTVIALVQYVIIWGLYVGIPFYRTAMQSTQGGANAVYTIGLGVCYFVVLMLVFMSYYLYMMCVTLKLKIRELFKNAAIFSFLCLLKNILLTVILGAFLFGVYELTVYTIAWKNAFVWGLMILFFMLIFFGFIFYTTAYFTYPSIKKFVLDPYYEKHPELTANGEDATAPTADEIDYNADDSEKEQSEYVYLNGRLVHRSSLNTESIFDDNVPQTDSEESMTEEQKEHIKSKYKRNN